MPMKGTSIFDFARAFIGQWLALASGGASVISGALGIFVFKGAEATIFLCLAAVTFLYATFLVWRRERDAANAAASRLSINFVDGERGYVESFFPGKNTFSVAVRNEGASRLTGCQLYLDATDPNEGNLQQKIAILRHPFDLNGSEERNVAVLLYDDGSTATAGTLNAPLRANVWDSGKRVFDASMQYTIALRATAAECGSTTRKFRFYVDQKERRLHLGPID